LKGVVVNFASQMDKSVRNIEDLCSRGSRPTPASCLQWSDTFASYYEVCSLWAIHYLTFGNKMLNDAYTKARYHFESFCNIYLKDIVLDIDLDGLLIKGKMLVVEKINEITSLVVSYGVPEHWKGTVAISLLLSASVIFFVFCLVLLVQLYQLICYIIFCQCFRGGKGKKKKKENIIEIIFKY